MQQRQVFDEWGAVIDLARSIDGNQDQECFNFGNWKPSDTAFVNGYMP